MNESAKNGSEATSTELVKPVQLGDDIKFPPFPEPSELDFEDDISQDERNYYKVKFSDLNSIKALRLHCTACDRHLGCSARNEARMRSHPMLRTLVCHTCHTFYNSGEFEKGDDGSELYCRWCGQGGQVYCCSDCCHVFCAKCIKRNLGATKIKEIENADDWKCFKCNSRCLWDIRATCWALLRYCDLKNKITYQTQDPDLKEAYQKDCAVDHSECCKNKTKQKKEKFERKKDVDISSKRAAAVAAMSKIPPTIQVKKFASISLEDQKPEKKAQKRSASPKNKSIVMQKPIPIASGPKILTPCLPPSAKKMRMPNATMINPIRIQKDNRLPMNSYARIKPKPHMPLILNNSFNGFQSPGMYTNMVVNDNINLSLESLTQGLDMSAVASMSNHFGQDDDLVCTPDFPLEPLCEVTEDNDDDVQCITPAPITAPKMNTPPPLISRASNVVLPDLTSDNIIQMTENDVTVNAATGGLKFRVDPQTLSSNKMYRLPDGRIFAINANPNMPGGYSATIVAVTENTSGKPATPKGATYAAKLSAISSVQRTPPAKPNKQSTPRSSASKRQTPKTTKANKNIENRNCDLNVPIEWFRYNLIDAFDALEYSMSRIQKLKKEATTVYLRSRTVDEMKSLHKQIDRLLNTSTTRFKEIRESLNKEMKQYIAKKEGSDNASDDDDVEILNDVGDNDDPIFIDENSMESNVNETQEVDLTEVASSEHNDSVDKSIDHNETKDVKEDPLSCNEMLDEPSNADSTIVGNDLNTNEEDILSTEKTKSEKDKTNESKEVNNKENDQQSDDNHEESKIDDVSLNGEMILPDTNSEKNDKDIESEESNKDKNKVTNASNEGIESEESNKDDNDVTNASNVKVKNTDTSAGKIQDSEVSEGNIEESNKINDVDMSEDKTQETEENTEMSEEMIETLLKDNVDDGDNSQNACMDIPDDFQEP